MLEVKVYIRNKTTQHQEYVRAMAIPKVTDNADLLIFMGR